MFRKIQSYVTPILLSYVDKYIKDFKTEDTQVSLWSGSVSLHNLELRPDIIQQEFNLPFSLSSGHIHELLIQVPWMKIVSEPIVITINTIECILKLADGQPTHSKPAKSPNDEVELDAPTGYVQSLVNRIVSNIAFRCNNIILKYVEEDIVVSVNIKQFHLDNVDGKWVPMFTEMTMEDLHTRKLIKLSDITLCLDKRNAAGKIETYLEPLLYKCELELKLDSTYLGISNKRPANTRISVYSPKLEFSFSYHQQIPMIIRISALILALKKKKLSIPEDFDSPSDGVHTSPKISKDIRYRDEVNYEETWSGWMWSFVQPFPLGYGEELDTSLNQVPINLFGINFDNVTFSFKVPDISQDTTGIYNQRKYRYHNICTWKLNKVNCEISTHGLERFCFRGGVENIELYPENICPCGISDTDPQQESKKKYYFKSTGDKKEDQPSWPIEYDLQNVVDTMEVENMLAVCPAFAFSYIYHLSIPEESKNNINSVEDDLEYSNYKEETTMTFVFGPFEIFVCAGMIHRLSLIKTAADAYDYAAYYTPKLPIKLSELPPPTTDDYDTLSEFVPKINMKFTALNSKINIAVWDHCMPIKSPIFNDISAGVPILNRKKISLSSSDNAVSYYEKLKNMPSILVEIEKLSGSIITPMYPNRLTYVTCQLPEAPAIMLDSCYKNLNLNIDNMQCFIVNLSKKEKKRSSNVSTSDKTSFDGNDTKTVCIRFITDCSFHVSMKHLLLKEYWTKHESMMHDDYNFNMNNITVCVSMAKMLAAYHILLATFPQQDIVQKNSVPEKANVSFSKSHIILMQSSLLKDVFEDNDMVHLDINFEGLSLRSIFISEAHTHRMVLNTIKVFAIGISKEPLDNPNEKQVWIISAPENNNQHSMPLVKTVMQFSSDAQYSSFFTIKIEEWSFIMDPLFCQWLTYSYHPQDESSSILAIPASESGHTLIQKRQSRRSLDEIVNRIGGSSRTLNRLSLGQSSSDREKDYVHGVPNTTQQSSCSNLKEDVAVKEEPKEESMFIHNLIKKYFEHKNMAIFLEIETVVLYFPIDSVSGLGYNFISEAVKDSVLKSKNEENMLVLRLPSLLLKSSTLKQNLLSFCVYGLPVKLPSEIWDQTKNSYPWAISMKNFNCSTLSCKLSSDFPEGQVVETNILKKFSSDLTISFTPKLQKKTEVNAEKSTTSGNSDSNTKNASINNSELQLSEKRTEQESTEKLLKSEIAENTNKIKPKEFINPKNKVDNLGDFKNLTSIGICIHIDTELISVSINENQVILLNSIMHGVKELSNVMSNIHKSDNFAGKIKNPSSNTLGSNPNYYNTRQRNLSISDNIVTDHLLEDLSKDSDARDNITDLNKTEDKDEDNKKNLSAPQDSMFNISVWMQWTISRASLKAYAFNKTKNESDPEKANLKLVFAADDIVSSLDIQHEYLKWNMKVVTAGVHHYKRNDANESWKLGDFCGIILKGKEFIKQAKSSGENSFLLINITRARCSSVHNKWGDICKGKSKTMLSSDDTYISEIEISLQALDIILNLKSLGPFAYILSLCNTVNCQNDQFENNEECINNSDKNPAYTVAQTWDSRKMALCYFEGHPMRIIMPVAAFCDDVHTENALVLQTDRILLLPIADNPVCRTPLRPDLYQQAARTGYLNVPGSELEDRQCQLTLKGISLYSTQWRSIENSYNLELHSQPIISENPALQWNDTFPKQCSAIPAMNIIEKVDICLMLALSIYHQSELICGPTIDISIDSDVEICLSIPQYLLFKTLVDEFLSISQTSRRQFNNLSAGPETKSSDDKSLISICPYRKFINKNSFKYCYENIDVETERATPTLSVDTGIASDMMSSFTETSKSSPKFTGKNVNAAKFNENKMPNVQADYFDIFVTFGKIGFNLFEIVSPSGLSSSNEYVATKEDKDDRGTATFFSKPLLYITFHQPNFSYSNSNFIIKSQFSIFHVSISLGDECTHRGLPKINDFLIDLYETKPGIPDANSGISPAFLTTKWEKNIGKKNSMKIDIKCPIRLTLSLDRLLKLNNIIQHLIKSTQCDIPQRNISTSVKLESPSSVETIKSIFASYSSIELSTSQIVLAVIVQDQIDFEILLSLLSYKHTITFNSRREEITNLGIVDSLTLSLRKTDDRQTKILVNPWTLGFQLDVGWKIWHYSSASPMIKIFVSTDCLLVDLSSEHIKILSGVFRYWSENGKTLFNEQNVLNKDDTESSENPSESLWIWNSTINNQSNEQHYKDDLRAGAFKFIYGSVGYPLAYQVYIGSNNIVWCYPQPRAITRVHSFPIPFKITDNTSNSTFKDSVPCTLEYFSEVTRTFNYYAKFYIKQDERLKLDLSQFNNCTVLSPMWRIVMFLDENNIFVDRSKRKMLYFDKEKFSDSNYKFDKCNAEVDESLFPISSQALVASLRIDSYFNPHLVPKLQIAFDISSLEINLYNNYKQRHLPALLDSLKLFQLDGFLPSSHVFCTLIFSSTRLNSNIWDKNTAILKLDCDFRCDIINGSDMLLDNMIDCVDLSVNFSIEDNSESPMESVIHVHNFKLHGGPQQTHMLYTSYKLWQDMLATNIPLTQSADESCISEKQTECYDCLNMKSDLLITKYIICNDTNLCLKFGQIDTEENIILESRKCHLYFWRMPNTKHLLRLAINLSDWKFSEGICIEKPGVQSVQLKRDVDMKPITVIILVEHLSPVQLSVTFMGQLIIMNVLPIKFDMKLYQKKSLQLHGPSGSPTVLIDESFRSPSLLFSTDSDSTIRLRFNGSDSGWSGDIPLKECSKGNMPWLVKVPVKGETQHISIWCRVIKDNVNGRTLVTLNSLYIIKSHLPMKISVQLKTENISQSTNYVIDGKGSTHFLTCSGTTFTKQTIIINEMENTNMMNKIPLHHDMVDQLTFFPPKEDNVNIDLILNKIHQWLKNQQDCEWPYIFPEDDIQWNAVMHLHSTEFTIRYLPGIPSIDSLVLDMAPWALLGNCSGIQVLLCGPNNEDLCTVNHLDVIIPPPLLMKEDFYCRVVFESESYLSGPLYISPVSLGPYERKPNGCILLESSSSFIVNCNKKICIFSMTCEIKQNINIFRLSSNYMFVNQLAHDVFILPIAMSNKSKEIHIPKNAKELFIKVPPNQNKSIATPINKFNILSQTEPENTSEDEEEYILYIYLAHTLDSEASCPIRIDEFLPRKSVSLKTQNKSIPVILSCQEYRGQVYIAAHKDNTPQFLMINNANMTVAVSQVLKEFVTMDTCSYDTKLENLPKNVVQESWKSNWHCIVQPGEEIYYTMPVINNNYPELFPGTPSGVEDNLYITFAYLPTTDYTSYTWSVPVDVSAYSLEKFVKLPGYTEDIKVMVENHCFATTVTINNVTQDDISASDIRQRLLISTPMEKSNNLLTYDKENSDEKCDETINTLQKGVNSKTFDNVNDNYLSSDNVNAINKNLSSTISMKDFSLNNFLSAIKITAIFNTMNVTMITNKDINNVYRTPSVISLYCDSVVMTSNPNYKGFKVILTISDMQVDNPLFVNGGYDFNVVIIKQKMSSAESNQSMIDWKPTVASQIANVSKIVEKLRKDCLFSTEMNIEVWEKSSNFYAGLSDLEMVIGPISLYLEDTYVSAILDYVTDFVPTFLPSICTHSSLNIQDDSRVLFVSIPEYIILEGIAIANPIKCKRLQIQPINILLSLHSSKRIYLALDHSPLQFGKFERINVLTSSYRLGHALTMHYLYEAIFGAGWVVGSLEILGSPNGLVRRLGAGLVDLVREPCTGLMRGPWGFLVGMTHGSASLLKHLTQGTVQSMSMVMGNVARNLDRLSLDEEHMLRTERARRHRPDGLVQALTRGLQGLGLSLLGAIGGIAHEALVIGYEQGGSPVAVAAGLTRGFMGAITKPLSATADFLALTGQGLLCQAGWDQHPLSREHSVSESTISKNENFRLKLGNTFADSSLLYICQGYNKDTALDVTIVITNKWIILLDTQNDKVLEMVELELWKVVKIDNATGELLLGLRQANSSNQPENVSSTNLEPELQMDPTLRARIAAYVGLIEENHTAQKFYRIVLPLRHLNHCASMITFALFHNLNQGFPVL